MVKKDTRHTALISMMLTFQTMAAIGLTLFAVK